MWRRLSFVGLIVVGGCDGARSGAALDAAAGGADGEAAADASTSDGAIADAGAFTADAGAVSGFVVDLQTLRPLAGRTVVIAGQSVLSDGDGAFAMPMAPAVYDAFVLEPDRSRVSEFRGLTRRDPVLTHASSPEPGDASLLAGVAGTLSGGPSWPLGAGDFGAVYVVAASSTESAFLGTASPETPGPGYGPLYIDVGGGGSVDAEVIGLASFAEPVPPLDAGVEDAGYSSWMAARSATLQAGQTATVDLALSQVPIEYVAEAVDLDPDASVSQLEQYYRLAAPEGVIAIGNEATAQTSFREAVPDLTSTGAALCVAAVSESIGTMRTERCGVPFGTTPVTLTLEDPPVLQSPAAGATAPESQIFSWTGFAGGVYALDLETTGRPSVIVFTADTSAPWPDLNALGIAFPASTTYACSVIGLGPYAGMDDAMGENGVGLAVPAERRRSQSPSVTIGTP